MGANNARGRDTRPDGVRESYSEGEWGERNQKGTVCFTLAGRHALIIK